MIQPPTISSTAIRAGIIQMKCSPDKEANLEKTVTKIREAARGGAQIICLQELFSTTYFCWEENHDYFNLADPIPGKATSLFSDLARELDVVIIASLFEKRAEGVYHNTVAVLDAGGALLGIYRKHHIPDDPGYYEKFYFAPGDGGYKVFNTKYGCIGTLICWDQWYPEAARITSLMGAQVIFYPTAIGWALSQPDELNRQQYQAWQTIQRSHSIANGVYVVSVNRTGCEGEMNFWGGSFISDPFGNLLYQASHDNEEIHIHELDLGKIGETRVHWPFLRDRRVDSYEPVLQRYIDK
ncbi:MAG: carbon-nitrogen hydrolase [Bacteroidota bacterium]